MQQQPAQKPAAPGKDKAKGQHLTKKDAQPEKDMPPVNFLAMFRYATGTDWLWISLAVLASLANGAAMPCLALIMGNMVNVLSPLTPTAQKLDPSS